MRFLSTIVVSFLAVSAAVLPARAQDLEALFPAPAFSLTDQDGKTVTNEDLKGKTWVVDFIFTRCPGPCPIMTSKMVRLSKQVTSPDVRFVSITVDPAYDTPEVLKQYAQVRGATDPRFIFLTGERRTIYDLAQKGFKLVAQPESARAPILHDERFLLIDGSGNVRGVYRSREDEAMAKLAVDAAAVASGTQPAAPATDDVRAPRVWVTTAPAPTGVDRWIVAFPTINAALNATAGIFLCFGMILIKARKVRAHAVCMIAAVISSIVFLACYLIYHYLKIKAGVALTRFPPSGWRPAYLAILISHTILAVVILPMIAMTLWRAWKRQWERHRAIASPTFWLWLYVSVTGVIVYWMLYHLAPRIAAVV